MIIHEALALDFRINCFVNKPALPPEWLQNVIIIVEQEDGLQGRFTVSAGLVIEVQTKGREDFGCSRRENIP